MNISTPAQDSLRQLEAIQAASMARLAEAQRDVDALLLTQKIILTIGLLDLIFRAGALWGILKAERGTERICWLLVLQLPIFGTFAYLFIYRSQRDENNGTASPANELPPPSAASMEWAQQVISKNRGQI